MSLYTDYLSEIESRKKDGLKPKPIEDGILLKEIISQIKDPKNNNWIPVPNAVKSDILRINTSFFLNL